MSRSLVTGAAGFIGSHLCEALLARGDEVIGVDCFTDYYARELKHANLAPGLANGLSFRQLDLAVDQLDGVLEGVDVVFHLAAQPGVRTSWGEEFALYARQNLVATQRLLEACARSGVRRFVFASSSSVYGDKGTRPLREEDVPAPISPYGLTKAACEDLIGVYRATHRLSAVSLRYFTVFGPRQRPEMAFASFIRAVAEGRPVRIHGDGNQSRDFTYVDDAVSATLAAAERGSRSVYNISGGVTASVLDALAEIERAVGRASIVEFGPAAQGDVRHTRADTRTAQRDLGFTPRRSLTVGIAKQVSLALADCEPLEAVA